MQTDLSFREDTNERIVSMLRKILMLQDPLVLIRDYKTRIRTWIFQFTYDYSADITTQAVNFLIKPYMRETIAAYDNVKTETFKRDAEKN